MAVDWKGYTLATLLAILVLSLEGTSAQAPGDESTCAIQEDQPNRRVLMESKYYADLLPGTIGGSPVWTALDEDNDGKTWGASFGGECQRAVTSCHKTPGQDNWLLTQHISKDISQEIDTYPITIYVDIISRLSPSCKGACNNTMEVHRFITDSQQLPDVNQKTGTFIGTISQQPSVTGTTSLTFTLGPTQDGFYLGIRSPGSCYTINGLTIYRERCSLQQVGLALYPDIQTPTSGQVQVDATCVESASAEGSLDLTCASNGEWTGSPSCSCDCGYVESPSSCTACAAGSYRSDSDTTCQTCPLNTIETGVGVCECLCVSGFYRTASEGAGIGCTSPPSPLSCDSLEVSTVTSNSITVQWLKPQPGRSDFYYTVEYTNPDDQFGNLLVAYQKYTTTASQPTRTISGLKPATDYRIEVSVHNGVSNQDPDGASGRVCEILDTTTEASPGQPSGIRSLCTAVVWGPPDQPNGVIVGYDIEFRKIGASQVILTAKEANELFLVAEGSSIPTGQGDLEFRLRAKNSFNGLYSDWIPLGGGCPTAPTCEPPTECSPCKDPTECPPECSSGTEAPSTRPAQITNVLAAGDDIVVWYPPSEEVDFYVVRIYFKNSLNNRAGTLSRNAPKNQPWLEILQTFTDPSPIQGVEYYFQVRARNSAGLSPWSQEIQLIK